MTAVTLAIALLVLAGFLAWLYAKYKSVLAGCLAVFVLMLFVGCGNIALTWSQP